MAHKWGDCVLFDAHFQLIPMNNEISGSLKKVETTEMFAFSSLQKMNEDLVRELENVTNKVKLLESKIETRGTIKFYINIPINYSRERCS